MQSMGSPPERVRPRPGSSPTPKTFLAVARAVRLRGSGLPTYLRWRSHRPTALR